MKTYLISKATPQYRANLHCHSTCSDGKLTPEVLKKAYKEHGYQILAITDHERPFDHTGMSDPDFLMLTAYEAHIRKHPEYLLYEQEIHLNLFAKDPHNVTYIYEDPAFCRRYFKGTDEEYAALPRAGVGKPREYTLEYINEFIRMAVENGYLVAYNHPYWSMEDEERVLSYENIFSLEIANYGSHKNNRLEYPYSSALYDKMLRRGMRRFCHGGDDNHNGKPFDHPQNGSFGAWTMILADELSYPAVIGAMERGDMYASTGPEIKELSVEDGVVHIECSPAEQVILYTGGKAQKTEKAREGEELTSVDLTLPESAPYFRVAVLDRYANTASTRGFFPEEYRK